MRHALTIGRREFNAYFTAPIAYIVIAIFLLVTGWFFFSTFFLLNQANLRNFFGLLPIIFAFVVPAVTMRLFAEEFHIGVTMRLFAEEFHIGSYETLLTLPVGFDDVVLGKFSAACAFVAAMLVPTLAYPVTVAACWARPLRPSACSPRRSRATRSSPSSSGWRSVSA